jgi:hypothetical protein
MELTEKDLHSEKVRVAREAVEQALVELRKAESKSDDDMALWANRLVQRKADLKRIEGVPEEEIAA